MSDKETQAAFEAIVSHTAGISHLERIVGLVYDFDDEHDARYAGATYLSSRATSQDIFFPNVFDALQANEDFHIFAANFLEQQPDARIFIGIDDNAYTESRYLFDHFVVGKTRLCSDTSLPSIDASLMIFDFDEESGSIEALTDDATVWEQTGHFVKQNFIIEGMDVDCAVLTRIVLDGTNPTLRILVATHPDVTPPLLMGLLEQADPTEFHLLRVIAEHPKATDEVIEKANTLGSDD